MVKLEIKSDKKGVSLLVESAIFAKIRRMEIGLNRTEDEIKKYEKKYNVDSNVNAGFRSASACIWAPVSSVVRPQRTKETE